MFCGPSSYRVTVSATRSVSNQMKGFDQNSHMNSNFNCVQMLYSNLIEKSVFYFCFSSVLSTEHIPSYCGTSVLRGSRFVEMLAERINYTHSVSIRLRWVLPSRSDHFALEKGPLYPLKGRLGGTQRRSGSCGEKKSIVPTWIRTLDHPVHSAVAIPTSPVSTKY